MKRRVTRCTLLLTFALAVSAGLASTSEAGLFPGLFGHGCWRPAYRPCYRPVYAPPFYPPTQAFYGPVYPAYGPVYAPYGPASDPGSSCGLSVQPQPSLTPNDGWQPSGAAPPAEATPPSEAPPKTFADDENGEKAPAPAHDMEKAPAPAHGMEKEPAPPTGVEKKSVDPFELPAEKHKHEAPLPGETPDFPAPGKTEAKKPILSDQETIIEQKKPAPAKSPIEEEGKKDSKSDSDTEIKPPAETKESGVSPQLRGPALDLDEKITWRSPPRRTRLVRRAAFRTPQSIRRSVQPDTRRTPVSREAKVAKN